MGAESNRAFMDLNSQAPVRFYRTFLNWGFHLAQICTMIHRSNEKHVPDTELKFEALHQTRRCTNILKEKPYIPFIKMAILQSFILINSWTNLLINKQAKYPSGPRQSASIENLIQTVKAEFVKYWWQT